MEDVQSISEKCQAAKQYLNRITDGFQPEIAVVLGSGLGRFGKQIDVVRNVPYSEIPGFRMPSVTGHSGNLIFGTVAGKRVVCQQGRLHYYEGHPIQDVVFPVRVMYMLGARSLIVTNASGGINEDFEPGDIMLIRDHINFQGTNPLIGPNDDKLGTRFPDMTFTYNSELAEKITLVAERLGIAIRQGVYLCVTGPSYETPAEIRAFRTLGADAVGMSTVPEIIAAHHLGFDVVGLACITNHAAGIKDEQLSHDQVEQVIETMGDRFERLVINFIEDL
jgi:purine-nucleoside phosphorylase